MADFTISLTDPITGLPDITTADNVISIVDNSNYALCDEAGHALADFADFYKMEITLPSGLTYLYSSIGDGDETIDTPDSGNPSVSYTYSEGDGQYLVTITAVPTYNNSAGYTIAKAQYVYYGGTLWKLLQNSTGNAPVEGAYWTAVTESNLSSKYTITARKVVLDDSNKCYARRVYNANVVNNIIGQNWEKLTRDSEFIDATRLFLGIQACVSLEADSLFDEIDTTINALKTIASKYV